MRGRDAVAASKLEGYVPPLVQAAGIAWAAPAGRRHLCNQGEGNASRACRALRHEPPLPEAAGSQRVLGTGQGAALKAA